MLYIYIYIIFRSFFLTHEDCITELYGRSPEQEGGAVADCEQLVSAALLLASWPSWLPGLSSDTLTSAGAPGTEEGHPALWSLGPVHWDQSDPCTQPR